MNETDDRNIPDNYCTEDLEVLRRKALKVARAQAWHAGLSADDVEDLAQEALLAYWAHRTTVKDPEKYVIGALLRAAAGDRARLAQEVSTDPAELTESPPTDDDRNPRPSRAEIGAVRRAMQGPPEKWPGFFLTHARVCAWLAQEWARGIEGRPSRDRAFLAAWHSFTDTTTQTAEARRYVVAALGDDLPDQQREALRQGVTQGAISKRRRKAMGSISMDDFVSWGTRLLHELPPDITPADRLAALAVESFLRLPGSRKLSAEDQERLRELLWGYLPTGRRIVTVDLQPLANGCSLLNPGGRDDLPPEVLGTFPGVIGWQVYAVLGRDDTGLLLDLTPLRKLLNEEGYVCPAPYRRGRPERVFDAAAAGYSEVVPRCRPRPW